MAPQPLRMLLRQSGFLYFWCSRLAAMMANQMLMVAVGWQMYDLTGSAWDLGLVGLFQFVPALLLTLPAGHVADRIHRGRIFSACMFSQAVVALVLLFATTRGFASRDLILGLSVILGVARAFQMPAQQAIIPLLVPETLLGRAIALSASGMQAAIVLGPALGGILYATGGAKVYLACTALLLVAALLVLAVRYAHNPPAELPSLENLFAGVHFVWHNKTLLGAISLDLFAMLLGGATALLPMYAKDILHVGPQGLGLLRAAPAAGALLMSLLWLRWPLERRAGGVLLTAVAVFGAATVVFGLSETYWISLLALALTGAADNVSVVVRQTLVQVETPDRIRGRVSAVNSIFIGASNQLGEFESGATAALLGPVGSVVLGGAGTLLVALAWRRLFPSLARRDRLYDATPVNGAGPLA
ncbi:MAG TPA: MFS transporter [Rhodocyclaceae bacterium]|nr:MFS transporter [Rhodocyclaceae bacterium]HMV20202.1 MFS transporter [Rhodocyclaceae bacterium]HMW78215.1 MFS transporter [Rhodocyclaceae bacterium]HNE42374.1 MFS transporter [Rhodocyclaceae bacterium]HNM22754.1 MFS transporter [Rhodocyclaceae bacterium]